MKIYYFPEIDLIFDRTNLTLDEAKNYLRKNGRECGSVSQSIDVNDEEVVFIDDFGNLSKYNAISRAQEKRNKTQSEVSLKMALVKDSLGLNDDQFSDMMFVIKNKSS